MNSKIRKFQNSTSFLETEKKVNSLISLSQELVMKNPKEALKFAKHAYQISKKCNYSLGMGQCLFIIAFANRNMSKYREAMIQLLDALDIFIKLGYTEGEMKTRNLLGITLFYFARYEEALENYKKSFKLAQNIEDKDYQARILNNIGEIYRALEKFKNALSYYLLALEISDNMNVKNNIAGILINIGQTYMCLHEYEKALKYYDRSLKISQEIGNKVFEGEVTNKIGEIKEQLNNYDEALEYYLRSVHILDDNKNSFYKIDVLVNLGNLYIKERKPTIGLDCLQEALKLGEKISAYKKVGMIHLYLSIFYENNENASKALEHYKLYHTIEKQVATETLEQKLEIITIEFKTDQITKEAEIIRLKNIALQQKSEEIKTKAEELRKINEELVMITEEKEKLLKETLEYDRLKTEFFSTISHELKTPLNIIFSTIQLMSQTYYQNNSVDFDNKVEKYFYLLRQNSYRLLRLINNLLDISRLDTGYMKTDIRNYNIVSLIEDITLSVGSYIESKNIKLIFDTDVEEKIIACDADKIERILLNLLSNAVKFTESNGCIVVDIHDKGENIAILIKDTGIGIPADKLELIFERFRQVDSSLTRKREGSGIGLSLTKALIEAHGGRITVESEIGKGSKFIVELPAKILEIDGVAIEETAVTMDMNVERIHIEFSDIYS